MIHDIAAMVRALPDAELCRLVGPEIVRLVDTIARPIASVVRPAKPGSVTIPRGTGKAAQCLTEWAIENGGRTVREIASMTAYSRKTIENALTRLKKRGIVTNAAGKWAVVR